MSDRLLMAIGMIVGFVFGFNGIATLFNLMTHTLTEAQAQLAQIGAVSTLVLFLIVVGIIIKVRVLSSLIIGAVIGAVLNTILEMNGIHIMNEIYSIILQLLRSSVSF